ncbi:MAG: DUF4389 domain-containing protein [Acidimicrobiales bacterium]
MRPGRSGILTGEGGRLQGIYPLNLDVASPPRVARWRPLVNWLLVVPHEIWLCVLTLGATVVAFLAWFAILLGGRMPDSWSDYLMGVLRYQWRVNAYLCAWTDVYPTFNPAAGHVDPGDYPAILYCARPLRRNRLTVLLRLFLLIPHYVVLYLLNFVASLAFLLAWFAVLLAGRWPDGLRRFCIGYFRWSVRVAAFGLLVVDDYPPFGFEP